MKMVAVLYKRLFNGKPVVEIPESLAGGLPLFRGCRLFFLTTIVFFLSAFSLHPYYMSVTEIEYKAAEKEIQVACKIFTDDLEDALKLENKKKADLLNASQKKENEVLLQQYLQKHFRLQLDGRPVMFEFLGFEQEQEAVWIYLLARNIAPFKSAIVFTDVLYSYKQDQINIIHFNHRAQRKSHRFSYPDKQLTLNW